MWCSDTVFMQTRRKFLTTLEKQLKALHTYPDIVTALTKLLLGVDTEDLIDNITNTSTLDQQLITTINKQSNLHKNSLPKGYLVISWQLIQNEWGRQISRDQCRTNQWTKQIISFIHAYTYNMEDKKLRTS